MINKSIIEKAIDDSVTKCTRYSTRNRIPLTGENPNIIRFNKKERETFDKFIEANCGEGENYNPNEQLRFMIDNGDGGFIFPAVDGEPDRISSENNEMYRMILEELYSNYQQRISYNRTPLMYHEIHNHPKSGGFRDKMPECLSSADIWGCVSSPWSRSITAVSGANKSKMIFMKGKNFVNDYETESTILAESYKLENAYFNYLSKWETETRKVWDADADNGNVISKQVLNSLPKGTMNALDKVHERYEQIAQKNIGTFEESIKDIRSRLNKHNVDISIEW